MYPEDCELGYTMSTYDIAKEAVELIRSLFAPGIGPRSSELFDSRYTWQFDYDFDPEIYDDIDDYVERWRSSQWPKKTKFENIYHRVMVCEQICSTELIQRVQYILMRVYNDVFNQFNDTYYQSERSNCLCWIVDNKILDELKNKLASEKDHKVTLVYKIDIRSEEPSEEDE